MVGRSHHRERKINMVTKLLVTVKEIYEQEELETKFVNVNTQKEISEWDFQRLSTEDQKDYVKQDMPTGRMEIKENNTPLYNQHFFPNELKVSDLVLYLNRIK